MNYDFKFSKKPAMDKSAFNHYSELVKQLADIASKENVCEIKIAADVKVLFNVNPSFKSISKTVDNIAAEVESKGAYEAGTVLDTLHIMVSPFLKLGEIEIGNKKGIIENF